MGIVLAIIDAGYTFALARIAQQAKAESDKRHKKMQMESHDESAHNGN